MKQEIERKFLLASDHWRAGVTASQRIRQGYLCVEPGRTVRVRLAGEQAWLTIKGLSDGAGRAEYEYPLPTADALDLLDQRKLPFAVEYVRCTDGGTAS